MSLTWAIVISLVASIVGGIYAGLLVMRKITHDNKRSYANQIWDDFLMLYPVMAFFVCTELFTGYSDTKEFKCTFTKGELTEEDLKGLDKNKFILDTTSQYTQATLRRFRQWLETEAKSELSCRDDDYIIHRIDELFNRHIDIRNFIAKYPTQVSYFDKLYEVMSMVDELKEEVENLHKLKNDAEPIYDQVVTINVIMLDIIEGLAKVCQDIRRYRRAKPWTWRLFVPGIRN